MKELWSWMLLPLCRLIWMTVWMTPLWSIMISVLAASDWHKWHLCDLSWFQFSPWVTAINDISVIYDFCTSSGCHINNISVIDDFYTDCGYLTKMTAPCNVIWDYWYNKTIVHPEKKKIMLTSNKTTNNQIQVNYFKEIHPLDDNAVSFIRTNEISRFQNLT